MSDSRSDLLQGTLDMLVLKVVEPGPIHGYAISKRIRLISKAVLQIQQGSLYPALHRLERRGWVDSDWRESESGREAKFYRLTATGRSQLVTEHAEWLRLSSAIGLIMGSSPA